MKKIFSKKSKTKGPDKAYPICMDSIQGTEGPKADWDDHAEDKFDRCVEKVKEDSKDMKDGDPCWKGYEMVGMKDKNGKEVPNCVPEKKSNFLFDVFKSAQEGVSIFKSAQEDPEDDEIEDEENEDIDFTDDDYYGVEPDPSDYEIDRAQDRWEGQFEQRASKRTVLFKAAQEEMHDDDLAQKLDQFSRMVSSHDLTYQYSDDHRYYSAGSNSYNQIRQLAEELRELGAYDQAVTIWNTNVDQKLVPNARKQFYWS